MNNFYSPDTLPVRFLGTVKTKDRKILKVYATVYGKHVVMFPVTQKGRLKKGCTSVRIADLRRAVRLRLCC
ncbi:MAG: hypothetical protein HC851_20465 [Acaryochloris sp. RU_4_1]|nr:hypothetical protein [Acaryochloris sp. RU_4_1]NJR56755.1 hypothetical protein [Acaryochloris sp. CRU_2_0]